MENDVILNDKTDIWYTFNYYFFNFANDIGKEPVIIYLQGVGGAANYFELPEKIK